MNANALAGLSPEEKRRLLQELMAKKAGTRRIYPLTEGQKGLWVQYQLSPESAAYISVFSVRILSPLIPAAMRRTFEIIFRRHESLRTTFFVQNGVPVQEIHEGMDLPFTEHDVSDLSESQIHDRMRQESRRPFKLDKGPILRIQLYKKSPAEYFLLVTVFHIAFDHWSLNLILDEFREIYPAEVEGRRATLPAIELDYTDFVRWERDMLAGPEGERLWDYWQKRLSGELPALDLPTDRPRPSVETFRGASCQFSIDAELTAALRALAKSEGRTLFSVVLAAFEVLLHRYAGQQEVVVGVPTLGARRTEFQKVVGYFTNLVALRANLSGNPSFRDFLAKVQDGVFSAMEHQELPFPLLVQRLKPVRDPSRSPIFQAQFNLIRVPKHDLGAEAHIGSETRRVHLGGIEIEPVHLSQQEGQFDLDLMMVEESTQISGPIKYRSDLFDRQTIERMAGHLTMLLRSIVSNPGTRIDELPLLNDVERRKILLEWNSTDCDIPISWIHRLFERQVERRPEATAVQAGSERMTYRQLNERANRLARHLADLGAGESTLIGVCTERTVDMVVALLAVLKSGAAYVPIDPNFPKDRVALMLQDSKAPILITQRSLLERLPSYEGQLIYLDDDAPGVIGRSGENLASDPSPRALAYTIYTSGSTGKPKGVQVFHRGVANILEFMRRELEISETDSLLAVTTLSFDIAGLELFLPLMAGARLILAQRQDALDGSRLQQLLTRHAITVMQATPVTWRLLLGSGWNEAKGLKVLCGGEAWSKELADRLLDAGARVWNVYGPTETTIWSTLQRIERGMPVRIGRPIANTQTYILNSSQEPTPPGVAGELYIGGAGLTLGYLNRPELTAERFVANPFDPRDGSKLYKTGDVARYAANGEIEFLGRNDHQVKIRGYRIEIGEIETNLTLHPGIQQAVVMAFDDDSGEKRLVAYFSTRGDAAPSLSELRGFLKQSMPDYMVPASFVRLERFPETPNGKVDRKALPAPAGEARPELSRFEDAKTDAETKIAAVWQKVLRVDNVGMNDNFFELGGHSLSLLEVQNALQGLFPKKISTVEMFSRPTVRALAAFYAEAKIAPPDASEADRRGAFRNLALRQAQARRAQKVSGNEA